MWTVNQKDIFMNFTEDDKLIDIYRNLIKSYNLLKEKKPNICHRFLYGYEDEELLRSEIFL